MAPTDVFILNVGSGSCAVVSHPSGRRTMIDINNGGSLRTYEYDALSSDLAGYGLREALAKKEYEAALTDPIDWYQRTFGRDLWRFILSHPDLDHMSGIRHLFDDVIRPEFFWDVPHTKDLERDASKYPNAQAIEDAVAYFGFHYGVGERVWDPTQLSPLRFTAEHYWVDDAIEILSPSADLVPECNQAENWNDMSYVLRFNHAGRSVVIPGDVEHKGWTDLAGACIRAGVDLQADVLVASHHGRKSGYPGDGLLQLIDPEAVIVSTAKIPAKDDAVPDYKRIVGNVFSTRQHGTLGIRIWDDGELAIYTGADDFENPKTIHSLPACRAA